MKRRTIACFAYLVVLEGWIQVVLPSQKVDAHVKLLCLAPHLHAHMKMHGDLPSLWRMS
jgi:hypothetical protein